MVMCGFAQGGARWDLMDVEVERHSGNRVQPFDPAFLQSLALRHPQKVFIAVAVPAKLHPAVQFPVVME